jgi:hypothetical protein
MFQELLKFSCQLFLSYRLLNCLPCVEGVDAALVDAPDPAAGHPLLYHLIHQPGFHKGHVFIVSFLSQLFTISYISQLFIILFISQVYTYHINKKPGIYHLNTLAGIFVISPGIHGTIHQSCVHLIHQLKRYPSNHSSARH